MEETALPKLLRDVPRERLVAAISLILAQRAGAPLGGHFDGDAVDVEAFVATADRRQVRLLRKIAMGLKITCEGRIH
jgi:hypothetical protein